AEDGIRDLIVTGVQTCAFRSDAPRGIELGGRAEIHGRGGVDDQMQAQILLVDEELDVQPIEAPVDVPIDVAEVVADAVRAIVARSEERRVGKGCECRWVSSG